MDNDGFVTEDIQLVNNGHEVTHREGIDYEPDGVVREDRVKEKKRKKFWYCAEEFCHFVNYVYESLFKSSRHFYLPCVSLWCELFY